MAKSLMIQGTMSGVGKSLVTAGLCRVLRQDGYRVAPFKSQNMALNSFITSEGLEMGRAQVLQAQAAGVEPSVLMNPILLKPTDDTGSQVIVNGEVLGVMRAAEYFRFKEQLIPRVMEAYHTLAAEYDIILLEGAGSPAEINLRQRDIVNMGMARMAEAPVLLVGDIDRGGVFAQLYGTAALLTEEERPLLKATVINKFRGDEEILRPGLAQLEALTGVPVAGVLPYLSLQLDEEDSLSDRLENGAPGLIDLAVIRLPRISNFTDFDNFALVPGVSVRYVSHPGQLGDPDMVILPGTKNTMGDLAWLRQSGLESAIKQQAARGKVIFGVCGGYQMLGQSLEDPDGVEGGGRMAGLGLLAIRTVFAPQKTRTRVKGKFAPVGGVLAGLSGLPLEGYEIHMGVSSGPEIPTAFLEGEGGLKEDGAQSGNVYGSYVHGIFDSRQVVEGVLQALCRRRGIDPGSLAAVDRASYQQQQLDLLAGQVRAHLDLDLIYRVIEGGIGYEG